MLSLRNVVNVSLRNLEPLNGLIFTNNLVHPHGSGSRRGPCDRVLVFRSQLLSDLLKLFALTLITSKLGLDVLVCACSRITARRVRSLAKPVLGVRNAL